MATARIVQYYFRIAIHIAVALVKMSLCRRFWTEDDRQREIRSWSIKALSLFGISVEFVGAQLHPNHAQLLVANHTSWLDILVILTHFDTVFVAKEDVRKWPALGWLAARSGAVFVPRTKSQKIRTQITSLAQKLASGITVCVFPEGTTSRGATVLPFKAAMLQCAIDAGVVMQPLAIRYQHFDGSPASEVAFVDDMTLLQSFTSLACRRPIVAGLHNLAPVFTTSTTRQSLAERAETAIRNELILRETRPDRS